MARTAQSARSLTDHEQIREWAEERGARPACVRGTGGGEDVGMIRLDFPGYSGADSLQSVSWDAWFQKFDESNLALLVQDETARGQQSNFNKLVSRDTAEERGEMEGDRSKRTRGRKTRVASRSARGRSTGTKSRTAAGSSRRSAHGKSSRSSATGRRASRSRTQSRSSSRSGARTSNTSARGRSSRSTGKRASSARDSSRRRAA